MSKRSEKKGSKSEAPRTDDAPKKRPLPAALAKAGREAHAARMKRLAEKGREAIETIRARQSDVASNMYDIGVALGALKAEGVAEALGRKGFAEIVALDLSMALSTANALVALAARVPRDVVRSIGAGRAAALLELADATPEDDTPADLLRAKLKLPSGRTLDVAKATDQQIREGAKEIRDARPDAKRRRSRGFTTTPEQKAAYARFEAGVREHTGELDVRTKLVATRDGRGPKLRIEARFDELPKALAALKRALGR
jgi:hypothetical protein